MCWLARFLGARDRPANPDTLYGITADDGIGFDNGMATVYKMSLQEHGRGRDVVTERRGADVAGTGGPQ